MKGFWVIDSLSDIGRTFNLIVAIVCLVWLVLRRFRKKELYAGPLRNDIWLLAFYWTSASVVGTVEQLFNTGTSTRIILATAALLVTFKILWHHNEEWLKLKERK